MGEEIEREKGQGKWCMKLGKTAILEGERVKIHSQVWRSAIDRVLPPSQHEGI